MKKLKILLISVVSLIVILAVVFVVAIKVFLPQDKIKSYILDYTKTNFNREVSFDKLKFTFIGINLKNFKMSEQGTFENGTFVKSDNFVIKISPLPLLSKRIQINNILFDSTDINVIKDVTGLFNFSDMIKSTQDNDNKEKINDTTNNNKTSSDNNGFSIDVQNCNIKNANLIFVDKQSNLTANIKNFNLLIQNFSLDKEFYCSTDFNMEVKQNKLELKIPLSAKCKVNLNNFDMNKIFLDVETFETNYNNATVNLQGKVENINIPQIDCNLVLKNINEKTFNNFFKSKTNFNISELTFKTKTILNISSMTAKIEQLSLVLPNSSSNFSGTINWAKQDLEYDIKLDMNLLIDNFFKFIPQYNLKGNLETSISANQNFCEGTLKLKNLSLQSDYGNISNFNTEMYLEAKNKIPLHKIDFKNVDINSLVFKIKNLSGKYNNSEISLAGNFTKQKQNSLSLDFKSKNISNDTVKNFYTGPIKFILPSLDINTMINFNLKNKSANISKFDIKIPDSAANILGMLNWNNSKNFVYNLSVNLDLLLDNIAKNFPEYNMAGKIKADTKISNNNISGNLKCSNLSFEYLPMAKVSKLNLQATAKSKNNIVIKTVTGIFNDGKFQADGSLINKDIKLNLNMDKLTIKTGSQTINKNMQTTKKEETKSASSSSSTNFNYNVYGNIVIKEINVPYLTSKKVSLKTSLKSVTNTFKKATGTFDLAVSTGTISNVNKLIDNRMAKTFLSLFNIVNNNRTEETKTNSKNDISFQQINCNVLFTDGLIKTKDVSIKIPTAKIIAKGNINLKNEALNLSVTAGNYTGMKITGTMSSPKITYDVAAALTNVIQDNKEAIGNVLKNLFNKK